MSIVRNVVARIVVLWILLPLVFVCMWRCACFSGFIISDDDGCDVVRQSRTAVTTADDNSDAENINLLWPHAHWAHYCARAVIKILQLTTFGVHVFVQVDRADTLPTLVHLCKRNILTTNTQTLRVAAPDASHRCNGNKTQRKRAQYSRTIERGPGPFSAGRLECEWMSACLWPLILYSRHPLTAVLWKMDSIFQVNLLNVHVFHTALKRNKKMSRFYHTYTLKHIGTYSSS